MFRIAITLSCFVAFAYAGEPPADEKWIYEHEHDYPQNVLINSGTAEFAGNQAGEVRAAGEIVQGLCVVTLRKEYGIGESIWVTREIRNVSDKPMNVWCRPARLSFCHPEARLQVGTNSPIRRAATRSLRLVSSNYPWNTSLPRKTYAKDT